MNMSRGNHAVIDAKFFRNIISDFNYLVVKKTDCIQRNKCYARRSIINNYGSGPQ